MSDVDPSTMAAMRAVTPPRSQLDMLAVRVAELERSMQGMAEHNNRIVALIENMYKMQQALVEGVQARIAELTAMVKDRQPPS